jgi:hypothetical protein
VLGEHPERPDEHHLQTFSDEDAMRPQRYAAKLVSCNKWVTGWYVELTADWRGKKYDKPIPALYDDTVVLERGRSPFHFIDASTLYPIDEKGLFDAE